ncbi:E3 ubiquitin-protein ligase [Platanthera guangdongensis]|uniref:E3 ubiquitin-protein ligase n=1 Tax=Platanthera guangdongensis TaxID=2320717 RepID=A0ABR2M055_9ASPA
MNDEVIERELQALPRTVVDDTIAVDDDCSICIGQFEQGEEILILPSCKHIFHATCVNEWLQSHNTCPLCRKNCNHALDSCPQ